MKKLDLFIIKKFLLTFLFMIGVFVVIAVVFDVSENIDDFLKSEASFWEVVLKYYVNFCFYFGNLLSAFIVFLSVIWFTSKMAQQTELIAMLSGGIPYRRIIRPYMLLAGIIVAVSLILAHWIVPIANQTKLEFELKYIKKHLTVSESNLHREVAPGVLVYFHRVNANTKSGSQLSVEQWENNRLKSKITAAGATYHPESDRWTIERATIRNLDSDGKEVVKYHATLDTILPMKIEDFAMRVEEMNALTTPDLLEFMKELALNGSGRIVEFQIELHTRTANAFSIFILTLIGVAIASRKVRGGTGVHLFLAVIIGFTFIFLSKITAVAALKIGLPVVLAVWFPNMVFGVFGLILYRKAQK